MILLSDDKKGFHVGVELSRANLMFNESSNPLFYFAFYNSPRWYEVARLTRVDWGLNSVVFSANFLTGSAHAEVVKAFIESPRILINVEVRSDPTRSSTSVVFIEGFIFRYALDDAE